MTDTAVGATFGRTDDGNALRVTLYMGDQLRYVPKLDRWHRWDGLRWKPATTADMLEVGRRVADMIDAEVSLLSNDGDDGTSPRAAHRKHAASSHSAKSIRAMIDLARGDSRLWAEADDFDTHPYLWNFLNGTVDIRTKIRRDHDPEQLITKLIPHEYAPDAVAPRWLRLVSRTFQGAAAVDSGVLPFVKKMHGYTCLGFNPEQRAFILQGPPNTGKTQILEVPADVLGPDYAHKSRTELISRVRNGHHSSERLSLSGKHYVYISETSSTFNLDESTFKELTGDGSITTYKLYDGVERNTRVTWTIVLATNSFPNVEEWDDAIRRRVVVLPAGPPVPPEEQDQTLKAWIVANEAEGVLTYLVEGAHEWYTDWKAAEDDVERANTGLAMPIEVMTSTQRYADSQDHVGHFIEECLEFGEGLRVARQDVFQAFKRWRGVGEKSNRNALYAKIEERPGVVVVRDREFEGVQLRPPRMSELAL